MELMLQLFKIPLYEDYVFKGQGKLHELNGSFFNIWFELTGTASDPLVLLFRYRSIAPSLIDGSTAGFHMLPTDTMVSVARMYEIRGTCVVLEMPYMKRSGYVTLGVNSIRNEIFEFIR
jgi:hypothetical protein